MPKKKPKRINQQPKSAIQSFSSSPLVVFLIRDLRGTSSLRRFVLLESAGRVIRNSVDVHLLPPAAREVLK